MTKMIAELIEQRFGLPSTAGHDTPAEGELTAILSHRTHRRYTDMPISEDLMQQVLAAGLSAPTKSDLQQVAVLRVENPGIRRAVAELLPAMPWVAQAARFLVVCGDSRRIRRVCELRGIPFANDHLDAFLNAASDAAMVLQNLIRAASAAGLGACPISVIRNHATRIGELLALPDHVFPLAGLCLGWPSREGFVSMRLPMALTVHVDRYDDTNLEADRWLRPPPRCRPQHSRERLAPGRAFRQAIALWLVAGQGPAGLGARTAGFWRLRSPSGIQAGLAHDGVTDDRVRDCSPPTNYFIMPESGKQNAADMTEGANGLYP
jgi:nitroreductase